MRTNNWILLGISLALSIIFLGLYFYLGFNLVDWPTGLLLTVVWWATIVGFAIAFSTGSRKETKNSQSGRKGTNIGTAALTLLLVPSLVCAIAVPTAYGAPDTETSTVTSTSSASTQAENASSSSASSAASSASAQGASSSSTEASSASTTAGNSSSTGASSASATAGSSSNAATSSASTETTNGNVTSTSEDLFHYMLDPASTGIELYYSIEDSSLSILEPGGSFTCPRNDRIEFFVKPAVGYQTDMTFLHSGNASRYIPPDTKGLYNKIGSGALSGFTQAVDEAIAIGCLKEFHYSTNWDQFRYRQMLITAKPVAITVTYNLDGGTLDGKTSYTDDSTYYDSNVESHPDSNIITMPEATPMKNGNAFQGWQLSTDTHLYQPGSTLNVNDFWKYIQKNAQDQKIVFPMAAVWKKVTSTTEGITATPSPEEGSSSSSSASSSSSSSSSSTSSSGEVSKPDAGTESTPGSSAGTGTEAKPEAGTSTDNGSNSKPETDAGTSSETKPGTETESTTEPGSEAAPESDVESETQSTTGSGSETKPSTGTSTSNGTATESKPEADTESIPSRDNGADNGSGSNGGTAGTSESGKDAAASSDKSSNANSDKATSTEASADSAKAEREAISTASESSIDPTKDFAETMPGVVKSDGFASGLVSNISSPLMIAVYTVTDATGIDGIAKWNGIAYANRGCWVCYYMVAGILLTLIYGAGVLIHRRARGSKDT